MCSYRIQPITYIKILIKLLLYLKKRESNEGPAHTVTQVTFRTLLRIPCSYTHEIPRIAKCRNMKDNGGFWGLRWVRHGLEYVQVLRMGGGDGCRCCECPECRSLYRKNG